MGGEAKGIIFKVVEDQGDVYSILPGQLFVYPG